MLTVQVFPCGNAEMFCEHVFRQAYFIINFAFFHPKHLRICKALKKIIKLKMFPFLIIYDFSKMSDVYPSRLLR
jgi:hypothetical protein